MKSLTAMMSHGLLILLSFVAGWVDASSFVGLKLYWLPMSLRDLDRTTC
jgi:uncharacterized membrane protein YoaK (UPF0700 family)